MSGKTLVRYRGGIAHYGIVREHEGIYLATLLRYDGRLDHYPPGQLTLIQSAEGWAGNDHPQLSEDLGKWIVQKYAAVRS